MSDRLRIADQTGFTLLELLIALVVGMIAIGAVTSVNNVQQRFYRDQRLVLQAQQNLRGALLIMEQQIRLAGYDPQGAGGFGITDVRRYDTVGTTLAARGQPALFFTADMDEDGAEDPRNHFRNSEHLNFRLRDDPTIGRRYLAFDMGGGRFPLAENIHELGMAYAVDVDRDGRPDAWRGGAHLIWAVDTDNDNRLDTHLDANDDGLIDENDDADGDRRITAADGGALAAAISPDRICAVRIWLLAATAAPIRRRPDQRLYIVGDRIIQQPADRLRRLALEATVQCRNL